MQHLLGRSLPSISLQSTTGQLVDPSVVKGRAVFFCYPYTGKPGVPDPEGWDSIAGAHGSTPQAQAYSMLYNDFCNSGIKLFGVSFQSPEWQLECAVRLALQVPLLSDENRQFAEKLGLPMFKAGQQSFIRRTTLIVRDGVITNAIQPEAPAKDAELVLALMSQP